MKGHRKYLAAKFNALEAELDAARRAGSAPKACSACGFVAAIPDDLDDQIASLRCLVCDHTETQVELECLYCGKPIVIANEGYATCEHCGERIEPEHLVDGLTEDVVGTMDYFQTGLPANCGNCEGYHTVVERGGHYFCASCFDIFDGIEQCQ